MKILRSPMRKTDTGCWEWLGPHNGLGYGVVSVRNQKAYVHRVSYEAAVEERIPEGLVIDHLCRNPSCFRPDHLEPVTREENWRRGSTANKTHCRHGHLFDAVNTFMTSKGHRQCRACRNVAARRRRAQRKDREGK